jgi:hypothetical protein
LSGGGARDWTTFHSSFTGNLTHNADGTLTGHFTIVTANDGEDTVYCRYLRVRPTRVRGGSWIFDGFGQCLSASSGGYYAVSNRFVMIDYGSPGTLDYIDVNYYGPVGPSVPGGNLQSGDLISTP